MASTVGYSSARLSEVSTNSWDCVESTRAGLDGVTNSIYYGDLRLSELRV